MQRRHPTVAILLAFALFLSGIGAGHAAASAGENSHHGMQATASGQGHCGTAVAKAAAGHNHHQGKHQGNSNDCPDTSSAMSGGCCVSACAPTITSLNEVAFSVQTVVMEKLHPRPDRVVHSRSLDGLFKPPRSRA